MGVDSLVSRCSGRHVSCANQVKWGAQERQKVRNTSKKTNFQGSTTRSLAGNKPCPRPSYGIDVCSTGAAWARRTASWCFRTSRSWRLDRWITDARSPSSGLGEGSPTKIDYRKKVALILTSLLEDLGCTSLAQVCFRPETHPRKHPHVQMGVAQKSKSLGYAGFSLVPFAKSPSS